MTVKLPQYVVLLTAASLLSAIGCGPRGGEASGPSYADLVVLYNAEMETLDRLQKKRADLIEEYQRQHQPDADQAVQALVGVLNSAAPGNSEAENGEPLDPNAALDRAVESAEKAQQASSQLLETAIQASRTADGEDGGRDSVHPEGVYPKELQRQLETLDAEIEKQKARVERARQARDAAEPK